MAKMNEDIYFYYPKETFWYALEDIEKTNNKRIIGAMCYCMWGNCHLENPPEYFGEWMVKAGEKLGFPPIESELEKHFKELLNT